MAETPNPGSREALAAGCRCPRMDNANGAGRGNDERGETVFVQVVGCPLHCEVERG